MNRIPASVSLILLVACGLLCWRLFTQDRVVVQLRASLQDQGKELEAARQRNSKLGERLKKVEEAQRATATAAQAANRAAQGKSGDPGFSANSIDLTPYLKKDPAWAELRAKQLQRSILQQYGSLASLHLTPDQLTRLRELLVEKQEALIDARELAKQPNGSEDFQLANQAAQETRKQIDDEIKSLIGPDGVSQLSAAQGANNFRNSVRYQYGQDLDAAGIPLSSTQIDAIANAAYESLHQASTTKNPQDRISQAMLDAASQVLTTDQMNVFKQSYDYQHQVQAATQRAMAAAKAETGGSVNSFHWSSF